MSKYFIRDSNAQLVKTDVEAEPEEELNGFQYIMRSIKELWDEMRTESEEDGGGA